MFRVKQLKLVKLKWGWSREETGEHEEDGLELIELEVVNNNDRNFNFEVVNNHYRNFEASFGRL